MNTTITHTHDGVEIVYLERENKWRAEIRGRERTFESLVKCKEAIDKPDPVEKKPFTRIKAWRNRYQEWTECDVTSIAETNGYGSVSVWVTEKTSRSKDVVSNVYADTETNRLLIKEHKEITAEIGRLDKTRTELLKKVKPIELPK